MTTKRLLEATTHDERRRRTNSLGTAKVDCHTCQKRQRRCDRQRPKCGNCRSDGWDCGGFTMNLVWKEPKSKAPVLADKTCTASLAPTSTKYGQSALLAPSHNPRKRDIKFVQGLPRVKRKPKEHRSKPATFSIGPRGVFGETAVCNVDNYAEGQPQTQALLFDYIEPSTPVELLTISEQDDSPLGHSNSDSFYTEDDDDYISGLESLPGATGLGTSFDYDMLEPSPSSGDEQAFVHNSIGPGKRLGRPQLQSTHPEPYSGYTVTRALQRRASPQSLLHQSRYHDFAQILALYDEEFCILPLSTDCDSNPFRVNLQQCENNPFLLHSILALSFQHLAKQLGSAALVEETSRHRSEALQLYSQALSYSQPSLLLDTLLILFNFEVTQSAFSGWTVHLRGAQKILDAMNVTDLLRTSSRLRAQVATLVWWDITLAFISRKEPRLPLTYFDILIENNHKDEWTFFALNGCPAELIMAMGKLARLASISDKAAKLEWTTFNTQPVDLILDDVLRFQNHEDVRYEDIGDDGDESNARRDRYHCIEAWRYAILLYARRIFCAKQDVHGMHAIDHLTRIILDHIRCIRSTNKVQKQVLLPIFLAAAELGDDETDRGFVRSYCVHWSATARYSQFESALSWLEKIWLDWQKSTRDTYWWGCKVGDDSSASRGGPYASIGSELLLG